MKIPLSFDVKIYGDLTPYELNPAMSKARVSVFRRYGNANGSYFTDSMAEEMIHTVPGIPIIGKYDRPNGDFTSHLTVEDTKAYGFVPPENPNFAWEIRTEADGKDYEYACFDIVLWTNRYEEAKEIIHKGQSMELNPSVTTGEFRDIDGELMFVFDHTEIYGLCVLGDDVRPCFDGANFFEKHDNKTFIDVMKEEIKNNFSLMLQEHEEKDITHGGKEKVNYIINLPHDDVFNLVFEAMNSNVDEAGNHVVDYMLYQMDGDHIVAYSYADNKNYLVNYSIGEDNAVVLGEKTEVPHLFSVLEDDYSAYNDIMTRYNSFAGINTAIESLNSEISTKQQAIDDFNAKDYPSQVEALNSKISEYEAADAARIKKDKEALIDTYKDISDNQTIEDVTENIDTYTLNEIESKLAINFARKKMEKVPSLDPDEEDATLTVLRQYKMKKEGGNN